MGLNAGQAFFMKWDEFQDELYAEYPAIKAIVNGGKGFSVMRLIGAGSGSDEGQFERQGTYGNLKFRHPGLKDNGGDGPMRRWVTKPKGKNPMKISVGDYVIERRDSGSRSYNVYIYPPNYIKNSGGEPWIGAYMTDVDNYAAEEAITFARNIIRESNSDQVVASTMKSREISQRVKDIINKHPAFAASFNKAQDNLDPNFSEILQEDEEMNDEEEK